MPVFGNSSAIQFQNINEQISKADYEHWSWYRGLYARGNSIDQGGTWQIHLVYVCMPLYEQGHVCPCMNRAMYALVWTGPCMPCMNRAIPVLGYTYISFYCVVKKYFDNLIPKLFNTLKPWKQLLWYLILTIWEQKGAFTFFSY